MDFGTLIGILIGFGLIFGSIALGPEPMGFLDLPSAMIVFGGVADSFVQTEFEVYAPVRAGDDMGERDLLAGNVFLNDTLFRFVADSAHVHILMLAARRGRQGTLMSL